MGKIDLTAVAEFGRAGAERSDSEKLRAAVADLLSATIESTAAVRLSRAATERVELALRRFAELLGEKLDGMTSRMDVLGDRIGAMGETVERHAVLVEQQIARASK